MARFTPLLGALALTGCDQATLEDLLDVDLYFVKLESGTADVARTALEVADFLEVDVVHTYDRATEGFSAKIPAALVPELESFDEVEYVVLDDHGARRPDDEVMLPVPPDRESPSSLDRVGGPWLRPLPPGLDIAVVDSGVDADHPDLDVVADVDLATDASARLDGHGTHVAGTIAARGDGEGVVGVVPGARLHSVRVLDETGSGYWTDIVAGLEYVLEHPEIAVVNLSLGGPMSRGQDPLRGALERLEDAGVVVVIAAGNASDDTARYSPAGYDLGIVVSAYDAAGGDHGFATFSNHGSEVDLAAPGVEVRSTWPGGGVAVLSGTSMAAPLVAGAAAAWVAEHPNQTPSQVREALVGQSEHGYLGQGRRHPEPMLDIGALGR